LIHIAMKLWGCCCCCCCCCVVFALLVS